MHKHARTTPAIRAEIAASTDRAASMAQRLGITEATVYKWKKRTSFQDCSHTAHRLQTILTPAQERIVAMDTPMRWAHAAWLSPRHWYTCRAN